jgi:hypothetical protein
MTGEEVDQLSDYQLMNNEPALWSYSTIQQLSYYLHEGNPQVRPPNATKTGMLAEEISHLLFCCICHCFVTGASQTTWQPRWLSRYSDVLRAGVPKIIRAHSDEPEDHIASCAM